MTRLFGAECSQWTASRQVLAWSAAAILAYFMLAVSPQAAANEISPSDQYRLKRAIAYARNEDWPAVERLSTEIDDGLLRRYLQWRRLLDADDNEGHRSIVDFIDDHPYWPAIGKLQAVAESMLDERVNYTERRQFFAKREPLTKEGRLALAEALLDQGQNDKIAELVRSAWINDNLGTTEIRQIRALFGSYLRAEDHAARLERLLDDGQWRSAERMISLVNSEQQKLARARIMLQRFQGGVDRAVSAVPRHLRRHHGFMLDRIHWRRRKGLDSGAIELLLEPPDVLGRPSAWWYERAIHIRDKLNERKFHDAARLAKSHRQVRGGTLAEAEWMAGWLSLRFLDEPKTALRRFNNMFKAVRTPISRGRAAYWAGRAAQASGQYDLANDWYQRAAIHGTTFYGQEAAFELGIEPALINRPLPAADFTQPWQELADLALILCRIDESRAAMPFLRHLALEPDLAAPAMALAVQCEKPDLAIELAKFGIRAGVADALWSYPLLGEILDSVEADMVPLALAISRQESHFDARARSNAGALGLMQLMPATARAVGRQSGIRVNPSTLRRDAVLNMQLGTSYLRTLLERFDGDLAMVAAGYNAGPSRVAQWVKRHGDPRKMGRHDRLDWIELIAFSETRNYVQRVIEGKAVYEILVARGEGIKMGLYTPKGDLIPAVLPKPKPR